MMNTARDFSPESDLLRMWQEEAAVEGRECVVAGLVINEEGKTFVQKRSSTRPLFPDCWDIVGGHVEAGETLYAALQREMAEETGWKLRRIVDVVTIFDWRVEEDRKQRLKREFDFLVEVSGDLERPEIEMGKFSQWRWIDVTEVELLKENRDADDQVIYNSVKRALEMARRL